MVTHLRLNTHTLKKKLKSSNCNQQLSVRFFFSSIFNFGIIWRSFCGKTEILNLNMCQLSCHERTLCVELCNIKCLSWHSLLLFLFMLNKILLIWLFVIILNIKISIKKYDNKNYNKNYFHISNFNYVPLFKNDFYVVKT